MRLLVCVALTQAAVNLARPVTSYRVLALGGDARVVGLVTAAFAVLPVFVALPLGRLADRWRPAPVLAVGVLLLAVGNVLLGLATSVAGLALWSVVLGLGHLAFMVGGQTLVAVQSGEETHDRDYGWYAAVTSVGQLVGPALGGLVLAGAGGATEAGTTRAYALAAVLAALALPATLRLTTRPEGRGAAEEAGESHGTWRLLRSPGMPAGLFASLAMLTAVDVLTAYLPVLGQRVGIGPAVVGTLLSLRAAGSIVSRLLVSALVRRQGRVRLLVRSCWASALLLAVLPVVGSATFVLAVLLIAAGFLLGIGQPLTMSLVAQAAPRRDRGRAIAIRLTGNRVGQVLLPAVAGLTAGAAGVAAVFWLLGGVLGLAAAAVAGTARRVANAPTPAAEAELGVSEAGGSTTGGSDADARGVNGQPGRRT